MPPQQPEDADQQIVNTPYGRGLVVRTRKNDDMKEVEMLEFGQERRVRNSKQSMMYTTIDYPSVTPHVGDDVICQYGRGRVVQISRNSDNSTLKYSISLSSWRLRGRSNVICHVTYPPPRVVRKHTVSEMDAFEKVELAQTEKSKATNYFSKKKDYKLALNTYATAVDAVRNVQHDHTSTNEVRADLVVVMVTCTNNAATCCVKLGGRWEEASKFAKNALILLDALYSKRGKKIHTLLNKEGTIDAKLFGEWRVKSYLIVARSCIEEGKLDDAKGVLKKAKDVAMQYLDEINAKKQQQQQQNGISKEEEASLKVLTNQVKEVRKLLVECSDKKKAVAKIEKKRAKAMFGGGGKENNVSSAKTTNGAKEGKDDKKTEAQANAMSIGSKQAPQSTTEKPRFERKSSLNINKEESLKKSVSFSRRPPQVKEFERSICDDDEDDDEDSPWYSEHKEALIMLAVAGLSAATLMAIRRSIR